MVVGSELGERKRQEVRVCGVFIASLEEGGSVCSRQLFFVGHVHKACSFMMEGKKPICTVSYFRREMDIYTLRYLSKKPCS